ncbi:MAG: hypothetical protein ACRDY5_10540, partial [Acidimicrobiales bacterium]
MSLPPRPSKSNEPSAPRPAGFRETFGAARQVLGLAWAADRRGLVGVIAVNVATVSAQMAQVVSARGAGRPA